MILGCKTSQNSSGYGCILGCIAPSIPANTHFWSFSRHNPGERPGESGGRLTRRLAPKWAANSGDRHVPRKPNTSRGFRTVGMHGRVHPKNSRVQTPVQRTPDRKVANR